MFGHLKQKVLQMKHQHFYPALSKLKGRVLEIGFGDGESFAYYSSDCDLFALEKSHEKIQAKKNGLTEYKNVKFFKCEAEKLPFEDNFFDTVVESFVICSVNSLDIAMREIERVLKPRGRFIFLEHIKSDNKIVGRFQDIISELHALIAKNCHPNRNPLELIANNGLHLYIEQKQELPYIYLWSRLVFAQAYKKEGIDCEQVPA